MTKEETKGNKWKQHRQKRTRAPSGSGTLVKRGKNYEARWRVNGKLICRSLHTDDLETAKAELARLSVPRTGLRDREALAKITRAMSAQLSDVNDQVRAASIPINQLFDIWQQSPIHGRASGRTLESYRHQLAAFTSWLAGVYPEITSARHLADGRGRIRCASSRHAIPGHRAKGLEPSRRNLEIAGAQIRP